MTTLPDRRAELGRFIGGWDAIFTIMTKMANRRIRQKRVTGREPVVVTASVVVLCVLVMMCAGMLVPPLWTAVVEAWQFRPSVQECSMLEDAAARQRCYEQANAPALQHPAKGGNPPPILHRSEQQDE